MDALPHDTSSRFGPCEVNLRSRELRKDRARIRLQGQPLQLLRMTPVRRHRPEV